MGRKKGSPRGSDVNPLQRMLGVFLRVERTKLGFTSAEVARRLDLTDTYLRLAESGRAALNQGLVFKIIEVFAATNAPTHDNRTINFNRFALYLVGTHWVGAEMAAQDSDDDAGRSAFEGLASAVADFQTLYEHIRRYFAFDEGSAEQKRFLEEVVAPEVGEFLRSEFYGSGGGGDRDFLRLDELPTLNVEILLDVKRSFAGRSFVHTDKIAAKWEADRASQFKFQRGLFRTTDLIVDETNLDLFHYDCLGQPGFRESRLIFVNSREDERALTERFVRLLNEARARVRGLNPLYESDEDKLRFVCLTPAERKAHHDEIETLLRRDLMDHTAYWSFETHAGLDISFVGVGEGNVESIRNLTLRDARERAQKFERLWSSLDAARKN
jgi:transcriptional regulator with XRE-family HTH domain